MPSDLQTSKTFFLVSGIINILVLFGWGTNAIIGGIFTCGLGCVLGFLPVINLVGVIMDFIAYDRLNSLNHTGTFNTIQTASIIQIITILTGNIVSMIFGILTLQNLNKEEVKTFLIQKGIY